MRTIVDGYGWTACLGDRLDAQPTLGTVGARRARGDTSPAYPIKHTRCFGSPWTTKRARNSSSRDRLRTFRCAHLRRSHATRSAG